MAEIKHQHTVPVCYLANWGINGNQGRQSKIYFINTYSNQTSISSVNKLPTENFFYDIPELGERKQALENSFSGIEGEYAILLRKVLQCIENDRETRSTKKPVLSLEDKNELAAQFAIQMVRTPAFRNFYKYVYASLKKGLPFAEFPMFQDSDFQRIHTNEITSFDMANFYANLLSDRNWLLLINRSETPFLTSDNPGIFINHRANLTKPISPVAKEVTFYMPLSPKVAVELYHKEMLKISEMSIYIDFPEIISSYNRRLWNKCTRFMFSNKDDFSCLIGSEK